MEIEHVNAADVYTLNSGYSQALAVSGHRRTVYVSGQIPVRKDGTVPGTFSEQAEQVWANIEAQLKATGMGLGNIVRHTTYLSDRAYRAENSEIRRKVLQDHQPALTVIIAGIFDEEWLLEIEAVATK
ncbi:MAG: RidA family protein [Parasphingorhabdus sp.]